VFSRIATWTRGTRADAYGVTYRFQHGLPSEVDEARAMRERYRLEIPLAVAEDPGLARASSWAMPMIFDVDRIMFMVLDARGVVSYVASVAPGGDDLEAALDELFVATTNARAAR
ncbi:MAG: hypothetical protein H0T79_20195, partial [Deltaproteobacteria bacterium]|nr:hypothetical protein [Deltaproteobacteria bacterium]